MITWIGEDYINTPLEEKYYNPTLIYFSALLFSFFLLAGCAAGNINKARNKFYAGRTQKAAEILSEKEPSKRDRLLFLMEKGMVFHHLGQYESSIKEFLKASNLVEQQETISLTRQTTSLVTTEWITEYKGEYSERLWIHTYLMMNYLILNKYEDALVEAKQALEILQKHSESLSGSYFTRALIALCYDNLMEFNDAYIEYKKLSELLPDLSQVATDLYRLSTALGFAEEAEYYKKFLPTKKLPQFRGEPTAELVIFSGLGRSPVKMPQNIILPPSIRFSFVKYRDRYSESEKVIFLDSTNHLPVISITSDIGKVARASLEERKAKIITKEITRVAAKEAIAQSVQKNSGDLAAAITRVILFVAEEPDTRSWQTLPTRLTLLRLPLYPGKHNISIGIIGKGGEVKKRITLPEFNISNYQRIYRSIRYW